MGPVRPGAPVPRRGRADLVLFVLGVVLGTPAVGIPAFVIAAALRRSAALGIAAASYGVVGLAALGGGNDRESELATFGLLWLVMSAHAVVLASRVSAERTRAEQGGPPRLPAGDPGAAAAAAWEQQQAIRARSRALAARNPQEALDLLIGRIDLPAGRRPYPDGGLVDVNNVAPDRLVRYLGLPVGPERFAGVRADLGGFRGVEDVCACFELAPQQLDAVADRLVFLPMLPWSRTVAPGPDAD